MPNDLKPPSFTWAQRMLSIVRRRKAPKGLCQIWEKGRGDSEQNLPSFRDEKKKPAHLHVLL